jgi:uncharacterized membrane protein YheB (UPF0754 family)
MKKGYIRYDRKENFMRYLIASIIGAVIGYTTNWLAIKMLFRPYKEKVLFGFKIPFTPGVIPKEKDRIANSVGETIGKHLLTRETIVSALCSDKVKVHLKRWIKSRYTESKLRDASLEEKLKSSFEYNYEKIINKIENIAAYFIIRNMRSVEFREYISGIILDYINDLLEADPKTLLQQKQFLDFKEAAIENIGKYLSSQEFSEYAQSYLAKYIEEFTSCDKTIEEVVPDFLTDTIKGHIYNSRGYICNLIKGMLEEPHFEYKMKEIIVKIIDTKVNRFMALFINKDIMYEKIHISLKEYLSEDDSQRGIAKLINKMIDKILKNKLEDIIGNFKEEEKAEAVLLGSAFISENILNIELVKELSDHIEKKIFEYHCYKEIIVVFDEHYSEKLQWCVKKIVGNIVSGEAFEEKVHNFAKISLEYFLKQPLSVIINFEDTILTDVISSSAGDMFDRFIQREAAELIELLNIPRIVEDKINAFELEEVEKIILDVSRKELSSITWLGAILGAILGLLSPVLASLY